MQQTTCLKCGGHHVTYASQCPHCGMFLAAPFSQDNKINQTIKIILNLHRKGMSCIAVTQHLNAAQNSGQSGSRIWKSHEVAGIIYTHTTDTVPDGEGQGFYNCLSCRKPVANRDELCKECLKLVPHNAQIRSHLKPSKSEPYQFIAFNLALFFGLIIYVMLCLHYIETQVHHIPILEVILSIFGFISGVVVWIFVNLSFFRSAPRR